MNSQLEAVVGTAGHVVRVESEVESLASAVLSATGRSWVEGQRAPGVPDITLTLERSRRRFDVRGFEPVTRGVWTHRERGTVFESIGGSGFTQLWTIEGDALHVRSRWSPSVAESAAAAMLRSRFRALQAQVLLHYPALWWAGVHGAAPLHVSLLGLDGVGVLLAGPGGVGKSTLVSRELSAGATATCDNLGVSDGVIVHGVAEPLRLPPESSDVHGRRTTHGRREQPWRGARVSSLVPDLVVVVRRTGARDPFLRPVEPGEAKRALVAGTYSAGELQRFWMVSAALSLASGRGPAAPAVESVASRLTGSLPCFELQLGREPGASLRDLLDAQLKKMYAHGGSR